MIRPPPCEETPQGHRNNHTKGFKRIELRCYTQKKKAGLMRKLQIKTVLIRVLRKVLP